MFRRWKEVLPIGLIVIFSLILFRNYFTRALVPFPANLLVSYFEPWRSYPPPEYPNGPPNKAIGFDNVRIFYPLRKVLIDTVKRNEPPLWNPYNFAGNVLLGSYQAPLFHPMSWLFFLMPQIDAWSVMTILQPILAGLAMYVFLRVLGITPHGRLMGALAFAFSGFFMTWWQESYMYTYSALFLPLALSAVEKYLKRPNGVWLVALAASLALSIFSGMPQITFYVYAFTLVWILYRVWPKKDRWQPLAWLLGAVGLSVALAAVHLLPAVESYTLSTRIATDVKYIFDAFLLPPWHLVTLLVPDYFGNPATYNYFGSGFYHDRLVWLGAVPLILILTQILRKRPPGRHGRFFQIAFLVTLSLMISLPTTWLILYYLRLPLLSTITPSRIMVLVTFVGSVLAAYGTDEYIRGFSKKLLLRVFTIIGLAFFVAIAVPIFWHYTDDKNMTWVISLRNLVIPAASFLGTLVIVWISTVKPQFRKLGYACLVLLLLANSFLFAQKYLYFSERRFVFPPMAVFSALKSFTSYDRFWTYDNGYIEKNFASFYGIFSPEGYDAYMIRRYGEFLAFANSGGKSMNPDRSNALIRSTDHINDILADPYRRKTLELLGVRFILHKLVPDKNETALTPDPKDLPRVWEDGTYAIHTYENAIPRVKLYTDIRVLPGDRTMLDAMFDDATDLHATLFLEEQVPNRVISSDIVGNASISSYTPNIVRVTTESDGNAVLFLSDVMYPGWKAYVDGTPAPIYRADYTFRATPVPAGGHTVEFRYEPDSWKLGIAGTIVGLALGGLLLIKKPKRFFGGAEGNRTPV